MINGFLDLYMMYNKARTYAPEIYAKHLGIQLVGHALGWGSYNNIPPRGMGHNIYLHLIGESGVAVKSVPQNDVQVPLIPQHALGPNSFSPEAVLKEMAGTPEVRNKDGKLIKEGEPPRPQLMCPLGEFSMLLRSMKNGGNMANFKEIGDDLFNRRDFYTKKLTEKKYEVIRPYLSLSTTCTPEEFFASITRDMVTSGFLPRFLHVHSEPPQIINNYLPEGIEEVEKMLREYIAVLYEYFDRHPVKFMLTDDGYDAYFEIKKRWLEDPKNEFIKPFVSRYVEYVVKYADVFSIDKELLQPFTQLTHLTNFTDFTSFTDLAKFANEIAGKIKSVNVGVSVKSVNYVNRQTVEYAAEIIEPLLEYARHIVAHVTEEKDIAIVLRVFNEKMKFDEKKASPNFGFKVIEWSDALKYSHLKTDDFRKVMATLQERQEYATVTMKLKDIGKNKTIIKNLKEKKSDEESKKEDIFKI